MVTGALGAVVATYSMRKWSVGWNVTSLDALTEPSPSQLQNNQQPSLTSTGFCIICTKINLKLTENKPIFLDQTNDTFNIVINIVIIINFQHVSCKKLTFTQLNRASQSFKIIS